MEAERIPRDAVALHEKLGPVTVALGAAGNLSQLRLPRIAVVGAAVREGPQAPLELIHVVVGETETEAHQGGAQLQSQYCKGPARPAPQDLA